MYRKVTSESWGYGYGGFVHLQTQHRLPNADVKDSSIVLIHGRMLILAKILERDESYV